MKGEIVEIHPLILGLLAVILLSQSVWMFRDAQKNSAIPWLWGLWGLIQFPTPIVVYLLVVRKKWVVIKDYLKRYKK